MKRRTHEIHTMHIHTHVAHCVSMCFFIDEMDWTRTPCTKYRWSCSICWSVEEAFQLRLLRQVKSAFIWSFSQSFLSLPLASHSLNLYTFQYFTRTSCCDWNYFLFSLSSPPPAVCAGEMHVLLASAYTWDQPTRLLKRTLPLSTWLASTKNEKQLREQFKVRLSIYFNGEGYKWMTGHILQGRWNIQARAIV